MKVFQKFLKVTEQLKQREEITPNYPLKLIIQKKKILVGQRLENMQFCFCFQFVVV